MSVLSATGSWICSIVWALAISACMPTQASMPTTVPKPSRSKRLSSSATWSAPRCKVRWHAAAYLALGNHQGETMKITDLRTVAVRVPVERPTAIATRQLGAREYILVWIDTDDGPTGIGYTYAGTVGGQAVYDLVKDALRPLLI